MNVVWKGVLMIGAMVSYKLLQHHYQNKYRKDGFIKAFMESRKRRKPLLVVGNPRGRHPCGDVNVDIKPSGECPNMIKADAHDLSMFGNKEFGAVYMSHVIEHLDDPERALYELMRVADVVVLVYPFFWSFDTLLVPGHKKKSLEYAWDKLGPGGIKTIYAG